MKLNHLKLLLPALPGLAFILAILIVSYNLCTAASVTTTTPVGPYPASVAADSLNISWTTASATPTDTFVCTGSELLLVRHGSVVSAADTSFSIKSVADSRNRKADINSYVLSASEIAHFWFGNVNGWRNATNEIILHASNTNIQFAVLKITN